MLTRALRRPRRMLGALYERAAAVAGVPALAALERQGLDPSLAAPLRYLVSGHLTPPEARAQARVEARRAEVRSRREPVRLTTWQPLDLAGAVSTDGTREASGAWLTAIASVSARWGTFLHLCASAHPGAMLELGSCVGISSAYLASSPGCRRLIAIEGEPELARLAQESIDAVDGRGSVVQTTFDDWIADALPQLAEPLSLVYLDGHHEDEPTRRYVTRLLPALRPGALVVLDDIHFSRGMWAAWTALRATPGIDVAVNAGRVGLLRWRGGAVEPVQVDVSRYTGWWRVRQSR